MKWMRWSCHVAVCAPEPYNHLADYEHLDAAARLERAKDLEDSLQIGNLERAADWLVVNDDVSEVAILGFCMVGSTVPSRSTG